MKPEELFTQARAKLIWGEPAAAVRDYLTANGISDQEADAKMAELSAERNQELRNIGLRKVVFGGGAALGAAVYFGLAVHVNTGAAKLYIFIMMGGLYGLWKLTDGIILLLRPQSEKHDLTEVEDD